MKYIRLKNGEIIDINKYDDFNLTSNNGVCLSKNNTNFYIEDGEIDEIH